MPNYKQLKTFAELEKALPLVYQNKLYIITREERDALVAYALDTLPKPRRSQALVEAKMEEAKGYILDDVNRWLRKEHDFLPSTVLAHRPRFVQTWALAQVLPAWWHL